jgi:protein-tyrosine-phosphatase
MRRRLAALAADVESFGTMEAAGAPALAGAVRAATEFGIDLSGHRARPLPPAGLDGHALVIGFEPFHVAAAVVVGGAERSRTFLLTELATALEDILAAPAVRPSRDALIALADEQRRARRGPPTPIADPVGASERRFHDIFHEIDRLVTVVATGLISSSSERPD